MTNLLWRKDGETAGGNGGIGLDHLGGGEGPAGAALALVLHGGDDPLVAPVHGVGQGLGAAGGQGGGRGLGQGHVLVAQELGPELRLRQVGELVDAWSIRTPDVSERECLEKNQLFP